MRLLIYSRERFTGEGSGDESLRPLPFQFLVYLLALAIIPLDAYYRLDWFVGILCLVYLAYAVGFYLSETAFRGRTVDRMTEDLRAACGYMAYFLPFAGIMLAFADIKELQTVADNDRAIFVYFLVGLVAASVATLFIPVQYAGAPEEGNTPSNALRLCFVTVLFLQKVAVTTVACAVIRTGLVVYRLLDAPPPGG